jgi:hypothetical protein
MYVAKTRLARLIDVACELGEPVRSIDRLFEPPRERSHDRRVQRLPSCQCRRLGCRHAGACHDDHVSTLRGVEQRIQHRFRAERDGSCSPLARYDRSCAARSVGRYAEHGPVDRWRRTLIILLLIVIVVVVGWKLNAPGQRFLPAFARLMTEAAIQRGPFSFFSGRSYAVGKFQGRDVAIRLQLQRSEYGRGYLVVAVRTAGPPALTYDAIEARTRDDAGRRALVALAGHELLINVEEGWLKALWKPQGFLLFFPGHFSEEKWRQVLEAMHTVATSLEAAA